MWGISWVPWGCSVPWGDIMSTVGVILSTVGDVQYRRGISWCTWGDIMSSVEGVQYRGGKIFCYLSTPQYWTPPTVLMISPHSTQISKDGIPHGTEHPPRCSWYPPRASWKPPTVLNIPHSTQDNPRRYSWYPHGTQDIPPHLSWYPPTVLNTPHGTQDSPSRYSWYPPTVLNTSHGTEHPHGTAHTLYRVNIIIHLPSWLTTITSYLSKEVNQKLCEWITYMLNPICFRKGQLNSLGKRWPFLPSI